MSGIAFGVNTICRFCNGTGFRPHTSTRCRACDGVGFTTPPPTTPDENSTAAAKAIAPAAGTLKRKVLDAIREHGPISEVALEDILDMRGNTVRPRIWELERDHSIERKGKGRTPAGHACWLYVAVKEEARP